MTSFHNVGKHCELCGQQDFLPFCCSACGGNFCLEHRSGAKHNCRREGSLDRRVPECGVCSEMVEVDRPTDQANVSACIQEHIASGCKERVRKGSKAKGSGPDKFRCQAKGCRKREFVKVTCSSCALNFCFSHRHPDDHSCGAAPNKGPKDKDGKPLVSSATQAVAGGEAGGKGGGGGGCRSDTRRKNGRLSMSRLLKAF